MTEYRRLREGEEAALIALWRDVLDNNDDQSQQALRDFGHDPRWAERTFVAIHADEILASAKYWLREIRDAQGQLQRVGHMLGVATRVEARRQGHAQRLLNMAVDAMRAEGCTWSILFARDEAKSIYEHLGWRAFASPWQQGPVSVSQVVKSPYLMEHVDVARLAERLSDLHHVYAAFNARRPLSVVRDEAYWHGYASWMLNDWLTRHGTRIVTAQASMRVVGYAIYNIDPPHFGVSELCVLPDHAVAASALLHEIARETSNVAGARLLLPRDPITDIAVDVVFGGRVEHGGESTGLMAKTFAMRQDELEALFTMPSGRYWSLDGY